MTEKLKRAISKIKEEKNPVPAVLWLAGLVLAAGFWGIVFPRYMFTEDCVRIYDEDGKDVTEEAGKDRNLYREIGNAEPEQIEMEISILEWMKSEKKKDK